MMNTGTQTYERLSGPSGTPQTQRCQEAFIKSLLSVLEEYGFDGVDFDWYVSRNTAQSEPIESLH
jgi:chitinase